MPPFSAIRVNLPGIEAPGPERRALIVAARDAAQVAIGALAQIFIAEIDREEKINAALAELGTMPAPAYEEESTDELTARMVDLTEQRDRLQDHIARAERAGKENEALAACMLPLLDLQIRPMLGQIEQEISRLQIRIEAGQREARPA